ncbi:hypothetical protein R70723_08335 [Paenibacillus sp. FSL R7-0273]|uniref:hypothetical protein n=1 Tax=Paenibacillus sp. FSL R7-0273 TaxID=1536772 RepID=UPI0004F8D1B2|nr:hypothetical protein [Paenibacillus sp. FSL R7-0273]AIQ45884.1 hypothetical protein R70723_08335 [Paenibacillus sp. FSL R7-0273]OMF84297.1 hypothetical protein BK144_30340 [Paenibacillus sp. FSL R7-0273]
MGFMEEHQKWIQYHKKRRTGERLDRLGRGHGHGERMFLERVWWPVFGQLDDLHPEYEVLDWRGRPYFVDFVWRPGQVKFAIEIKGYGPHVQNTDRTRYRQELNRETYLQIAGYRVVSVPYDDLESVPELTISLLKSLLIPSLLKTTGGEGHQYTKVEKEILRIAARSNGFIRPVDLVEETGVDLRTIRKYMASLCAKGKFKPVLTRHNSRIYRYEYIHSMLDNELW